MEGSDYSDCRLCPRGCRINRTAGQRGSCGETAICRVASIGPHFGEEPCLSGTQGSGTVFFSGCSCHCFFCQNWQISGGRIGQAYTVDALERALSDLAATGVHNLNFVTPDHFFPQIAEAVRRLRVRGPVPPVLFNTSGFQTPEMIDRWAEVADIFLPDLKFGSPELARECMGDARYPELALQSVARMIEHKGFLHPFDPEGRETARTGVLVRHLVLPGALEHSQQLLLRLRREFGRFLPLSIMSQYHPVPACAAHPRFNRRLSADEHRDLRQFVETCGFESVFFQELHGDDSFLPDFDREHPFKGNER